MCAVIGIVLKSPSNEDFELVTKIFLESKIRGLHATGLSYVKNDKIITEKYPIPADQFKFDFPNYINEDGNLYLIGHCRYSTSDLQYNQPISNDNFSVAHNGVITQELPQHWEELYGYNCSTKNDTELLLHTLENDKSSLHVWHNSSLAVCELHKDKTLRFYRNGKRPLYSMNYKGGYLITSTNDILNRAGIQGSNDLIDPNTYYSIKDFTLNQTATNINDIDLQKVY
jgi:glutamine phosphoribosylpyrophosphate amidotransferase